MTGIDITMMKIMNLEVLEALKGIGELGVPALTAHIADLLEKREMVRRSQSGKGKSSEFVLNLCCVLCGLVC